MCPQIDLNDFKVVTTAQSNGQAIVNVIFIFGPVVGTKLSGLVVDGINSEIEIQRAIAIGSTDSVVAVARGLIFNACQAVITVVNLVAHAILREDLEAREVWGFVGDHIVPHAATNSPVAGLSRVVTPGCTKGGNDAVFTPRGNPTIDRAHSTECEFAETALQEKGSFTMEEGVLILESAGV